MTLALATWNFPFVTSAVMSAIKPPNALPESIFTSVLTDTSSLVLDLETTDDVTEILLVLVTFIVHLPV